MSEEVYGPIITGCATLIFGWVLVMGCRRGEITFYQSGLSMSGRRKDQPVRFWAVVMVVGLLAVLSLLGTVLQVFWPHGL